MNIIDENLTHKLPSNMIINILKMIPRDSQMKSPTSDLITQELNNVYIKKCENFEGDEDDINLLYPSKNEIKQYFVDLYFFWYRCSQSYELRLGKLQQLYGSPEESETESETESNDE